MNLLKNNNFNNYIDKIVSNVYNNLAQYGIIIKEDNLNFNRLGE
jgi:hypothetical protein